MARVAIRLTSTDAENSRIGWVVKATLLVTICPTSIPSTFPHCENTYIPSIRFLVPGLFPSSSVSVVGAVVVQYSCCRTPQFSVSDCFSAQS